MRGGFWQQVLTEDQVQVMANKPIRLPEAKIIDSDEIAIVSSSPFCAELLVTQQTE